MQNQTPVARAALAPVVLVGPLMSLALACPYACLAVALVDPDARWPPLA